MSLHQIIYTCRKSGLYGEPAGFGILSSDRGFDCPAAGRKYLSDYRQPNLKDGIEFSEKIISCIPGSFTYRPLGDDLYAVTRSTFLGVNPFGEGFNSISHTVTFTGKDSELCPCEYIDTPSLMARPEMQDVLSPDGTGYLDVPVLMPGSTVSVNKVMKFLSQPGKFQIFEGLLHAVLTREESGKTIIICDEPESTVLWIASINYALPLSFARRISFTTYAFDPHTSDADICGVLPKHTEYNESYDNDNAFYVFDMIRGTRPEFDLSADTELKFRAFMEETMLHNYDKLTAFHTFVDDFCDMSKLDSDYMQAYVMCLACGYFNRPLPDGSELLKLSALEFAQVASFSGRCAAYGAKLLLTEAVLDKSEQLLGVKTEYLLSVLSYITGVYRDASARIKMLTRNMIVDAVPVTMIAREMTSDKFATCYAKLLDNAADCGMKLNDELMAEKRRATLMLVLRYQPAVWKLDFVIERLSEYTHENAVDGAALLPGEPLGKFLADVMAERYKLPDDASASRSVMSYFTDDVNSFCAVEENLETTSDGLPDGNIINSNICLAFFEFAASKLYERRNELWEKLSVSERYDLVWGSFSKMLETCEIKAAEALFTEHYNGYLCGDDEYGSLYLKDAIEEFYAVVKQKRPDDIKTVEPQLFDILLKKELIVSSSDAIVSGMVNRAKFSEPNSDAEKLINSLSGYERDIRGKMLSGKLLCLVFGIAVKAIKNRKDYDMSKQYFSSLTSSGAIDMTLYSEADGKDYLEWVLPIFSECVTPVEVSFVYGLFRLTASQSAMFAAEFGNEFIRVGKSESNYAEFCKYLHFVFTQMGAEELQEMADIVHKLNSKRLEQLRIDAKTAFADDYTLMEKFNHMVDMQPRKKSIFSIFKK